MADEVLLRDLDDGVLTLTLNRPERMNALDPALMRALRDATREAAEDVEVACVVLKGAGKSFCAGGDMGVAVAEARTDEASGPPGATVEQPHAQRQDSFESRVAWLRENMEAVRFLRQMPKPTIASVHGAAAGGGLCLAAACDLRIVADNSRFITAFVHVGLSGDYAGTYFLTRLLGPMKARELYFLGEKFDAQEAYRLGFVTRLVATDQLEAETRSLARRLARGPRVALRYMKKTLNAAEVDRLEDILDMEAFCQVRAAQTEDHREAAKAFLEKRPNSTGR